MRTSVILLVIGLAASAPAGYDDDRDAAAQLTAAGKHADALAAFLKLAETAADAARRSDSLHQAALCAAHLKQYDRALELAGQIPLAPTAKAARLQVMGQSGRWRELLDAFASEDLARWPQEFQGEAFHARGAAFYRAKDGPQAEADLKRAVATLARDRDQMLALGTLAETYRTLLRDQDKALAVFLEVQRRAEKTDRWGWSLFMSSIAASEILTGQGKHAEALAALGKVDVDNLKGYWRSAVLAAYGSAYAAQGKLVAAVGKLQEAAEVPDLPSSNKAALGKRAAELLAALNRGGSAADLVIGIAGKSDYQIVLPDKFPDAEIETWLAKTAQLMQNAFTASGFQVPIVAESRRDRARPGLYLGDTAFARAAGIQLGQLSEWGYRHKTVGRDVLIAGRDRPCPIAPPPGGWRNRVMGRPELGTVKAAADFLRQYLGVRFLYPGETGIEFLGQPVVAVPKDLDVVKTSAVRFNFSYFQRDDPYYVANNYFFPLNRGYHNWEGCVPADAFRRTHPEYFALVNGQRCCLAKDWTGRWAEQYCLSNPAVRELIYRGLLAQADRGIDVVSVNHPDGFVKCQCHECRRLYGTGDDWCEKVWLFYRELAQRLAKERPGRNVDFYSYGPTYAPPKTFHAFPANTRVMLCRTTPDAFAEWGRCQVPGGFTAYLYNWGIYHRQACLPKQTARFVAAQVKTFCANRVQGVAIDGFGESFGLDGLTYYAYGRMFDDPAGLDGNILADEFCAAAFREACVPMKDFFAELHHAIAAGGQIDGYEEDATGARRPVCDDPLHYLAFAYTPARLAAMEERLAQAERLAAAEKVRRRLKLVRAEFDVLRSTLAVVQFYNAYRMRPDEASRDGLLRAIDERNAVVDSLYITKTSGPRTTYAGMKPIDGWPEVLPFSGHRRERVGLTQDQNAARYKDSVFSWDTSAVRRAPLPTLQRPRSGP